VWLRLIFKDHKPTAKFKAPLRGGGICEVKAGKQTSHIFQALKTKLDLAITFQKQNGQSRVMEMWPDYRIE